MTSAQRLWDRFEQIARSRARVVAVACHSGGLTFGDLEERSRSLSHTLAATLGSMHDDGPSLPRVGIVCERSESTLIALLAVSRIRATAVPLDARRTHDDIHVRSAAMGCSFHVVDGDRRWNGQDIAIDAAFGAPISSDSAGSERSPVEPYYVLGTTGTTGRPKGVLQSEENLLAHVDAYARSIQLGANDHLSLLYATCTDAGFMDIFACALWGVPIHPWDARERGLHGIAEWVARSGITVLHVTPSLFSAVLGTTSRDPPRRTALRAIVFGGEALRGHHLEGIERLCPPEARVVNGYGPTECTVALQAHYEAVSAVVPERIGSCVPGVEAYIDPSTIGEDGAGELILVSDRLALGYVGDDDAHHRKFQASQGRRHYRTGDRARRHADGGFSFAGRMDRRVKVHGLFVDCARVEECIRERGAGGEIYVDLDHAGVLTAWITGPTSALGAAEVRTWLASALEPHEVPSAVLALESLPRTPSGKVDAVRLRAHSRRAVTGDRNGANETAAGSSPIERAVRTALGRSVPSLDESFFSLGGDSLSFLTFAVEIDRIVGYPTGLTHALADVPLREIAREIDRAEARVAPAVGPDDCALSPSEVDFWLSELTGVGLMTPRLHLVLAVDAPLQIPRLRASCARVVRAVPRLSMCVDADHDAQPRWRLGGAPMWAIDTYAEDGTDDWIDSFLASPLSCVRGPALRVGIGRAHDRVTRVAVVAHHAYVDGFAIRELVRRVFAVYDGHPSSSSIADGTRGAVSDVEQQASAWYRYLSGAARARYPGQRAGARAAPIGGVEVVPVAISARVKEFLRARATSQGLRAFAIWSMAFASALEHVVGDPDLAIPTVVSGRGGDRPPNAVACYINTIYARCRLDPGRSRIELFERFVGEFGTALALQRTPRQRVHEKLGWTESGIAVPNVFLSYHSWVDDSFRIGGAEARRIPSRAGDQRVPFSLDVTRVRGSDGSDDTVALCSYDPTQVAGDDVGRVLVVLERELEAWARVAAGVADPSEVYPTAWSRNVVLGNSSAGDEDRDPVEDFLAHARRAPSEVAVVHRERAVTYEALAAAVSELETRLRNHGLSQRHLAPVRCADPIATVTAWLGAWRTGASFVTISDTWPVAQLSRVAREFGIDALIDDAFIRGESPQPCPAWPALPTDLRDAVAYGCFTSGTTGTPRLALVSRRGLRNRLRWMRGSFAAAGGEAGRVVTVRTTPFEYDSAIWQVLWPLSVGGTVVLPDRHDILDRARFEKIVAGSAATVVDFVPSVLSALLSDVAEDSGSRAAFRTLRHVIIGGERIRVGAVRRLEALAPTARLWNLYGTTEATIGSVAHSIAPGEQDVPLGRPIDGTFCAVVGEGLRPLPAGQEGEIVLGGACAGLGYLCDEIASATRFAHVPDAPAGGWLVRTGDVGIVTSDGLLRYVGRVDSQIKRHGVRVDLEGIARAIERFGGGVRSAYVLDQEDRGLVAFIVGACEAHEVERWVARNLAPAERPSAVFVVDAIPITAVGKVDKPALVSIAGASRLRAPSDLGASQAVGSAGALAVRTVWSRLLGRTDIPWDASFFDLGGHSLLAIEAAILLSRKLNTRVPVATLFAYPTARDLAAELDRTKDEG